MKTIPGLAAFAVAVAALAAVACSSDPLAPGSQDASISVVNALSGGAGASLKVDQSVVTLPTIGHATSVTLATGNHHLQLSASSGQSLVDTTIAVIAGKRRTVVFSGSGVTSAGVSVVSDTITTDGTGHSYHPIVGSVLMVNSVPGSGPYDIRVTRAQSDSVDHFGSFSYGAGSLPPPAPYGFYIPFEPGVYTFNITMPNQTTALASTSVTLATDDRWTIILTNSIEGGLVLTATKQ